MGEKKRKDTNVIIIHEEWDKCMIKKNPIPNMWERKVTCLHENRPNIPRVGNRTSFKRPRKK